MLSEFDKLVKQRQSLKDWWSLGSIMAAYDRNYHILRVDIQTPSMIAFCGQQYAGARNYHDAPAFFFEAVRVALQSAAGKLTEAAYHSEIARLDAAIEKHKAAVLKELEST